MYFIQLCISSDRQSDPQFTDPEGRRPSVRQKGDRDQYASHSVGVFPKYRYTFPISDCSEKFICGKI